MARLRTFKDQAANAFTKTNLFYSRGPFLGIQDPTIFGFKIFFHFDVISSPLLYGANTDINSAPTNTAAGYLKSIGDEQRLFYLEKFLYLLSGINSQTPWYFQKLDGLKDAWKQDITKPLLKDKSLKIECIESIDLRITALMDLYRKACYDWKYRRCIIPDNLRKFKMSVYIYEARYINNSSAIASSAEPEEQQQSTGIPLVDGVLDSLNNIANPGQISAGYGVNNAGQALQVNADLVSRLTGPDETRSDPNTQVVNIMEGVPMSTTRNLFHFDFCEFDMSEPGHLESLDMGGLSDVKNTFKIMYGDVEEENMYNFWLGNNPVSDGYVRTFDRAALDDPALQPPGEPTESDGRPSILQRISNAADAISKAAADINDIRQDAKDKLEQVNKDNIFKKFKAIGEGSSGNIFGAPRGNPPPPRIARIAKDKALSAALRLLLGNVHGFSVSTLGREGVQGLLNSAEARLTNPSISNAEGKSSATGNTSYGASLANDDDSNFNSGGNTNYGASLANDDNSNFTSGGNTNYGASLANDDSPGFDANENTSDNSASLKNQPKKPNSNAFE